MKLERYDVDMIVAQAIGGLAGNAIGTSLGTALATSLDKQIEQLQSYIQSSSGSVHSRTPELIKISSTTATNKLKLDQLSKSKPEIDSNKSRAERFQKGAVSSNKWEQWQLNARDALIQDEMASVFPKDIDLSNSEHKQVENWQKPTAVKARSDQQNHFANNPAYKRVVGLDGQISYVDNRGNLYRVTAQGIRRIQDPPVESFHPEDLLFGGLEVAASKGALLTGGKILGKYAPELAILGGKMIGSAKGLGDVAFAKLAAGFGLLSTRISSIPKNQETAEVIIRHTDLISKATKSEVRSILRNNELNLPPGQTAKLLKILGNGRMDSISLRLMKDGEIRFIAERAGAANGYQRMSFEIDNHGSIVKIVQTAFDNENILVPQRPGEIKNNLFDVKLWNVKTY